MGISAHSNEAGSDATAEPAGGLEWPQVRRAMVRELYGRDPPPTAILAMSDDIAAGVRVAARSASRSRQLSVVGFDDTPVASGPAPPPTTVRRG